MRDNSPDLHLDSTALPASEAWAEPDFQEVLDADRASTRRVTFLVGYTPHASGSAGQMRFKLDWDFGPLPGTSARARPAPEPVVDRSTVTDTAIDGVTYGQVAARPLAWLSGIYDGSTIGAVEQFEEYTFEVPSAAVGVRMSVAEVGEATNRGTARIFMATSKEF